MSRVLAAGRGEVSVHADTLERVRRVLAACPDVAEKRMVGGLSFSYQGRMFCGVTQTGLMVRVGKDGRDAALAEPHVRALDLGGRQPLGFVVVEPAGYLTDEALRAWLERGLATVRTRP